MSGALQTTQESSTGAALPRMPSAAGSLSRTVGVKDRLLVTAFHEASAADCGLLTSGIARRLDTGSGGVALLLDGLDETHDDRRRVVTEIETLLRDTEGSAAVAALLVRDRAQPRVDADERDGGRHRFESGQPRRRH